MRFFICLTIFLFIVSCSKPNKEYSWETKKNSDVYSILVYSNHIQMVHGPQITSDPYSLPTIEWIENIYAPYLKKFLSDNGLNMFDTAENNCVKFSAYGFAAGHMLFYKNGPNNNTSLAIGIVDYSRGFYEWHSINVFLARDEYNNIIVYYFEPQTQTRVPNEELENQWWSMRF